MKNIGAPGVDLTGLERDVLLRAIEAALDVHERGDFRGWLDGPFRSLVPHTLLAGVELDEAGRVRHAECLNPGEMPETPGANALCHAMQLAAAYHACPELPPIVDARKFGPPAAAVPVPLSGMFQGGLSEGAVPEGAVCGGALLHRTRLVSGAAVYFVFFDVPASVEARGRHHIRLLSSQLKTAWSRVVGLPSGTAASPALAAGAITAREREILGWMRLGKSNQEISQILCISPLTLKAHVRKIYRKLDVADRESAVARGLGPGAAARADTRAPARSAAASE